MMKKIKLISSTGTENFEKDLNKWLDANQNNEIISISHSTVELTLPAGPGQIIKGYELTAVILYREVAKRPEPSFGD